MGTKGFGSIHLPKDANSEQEEAREMYRDAVQDFRAAVQRRCGFDLNEVRGHYVPTLVSLALSKRVVPAVV
jgi:hypothetical protein